MLTKLRAAGSRAFDRLVEARQVQADRILAMHRPDKRRLGGRDRI